MNKYIKPSYLPALTLLSGFLGLVLRAWLVLAATDIKGLLVTTHPAHILLFVLTALVLAAIFLFVRPLGVMNRYQELFPNGILSGTGCIVSAVGILAWRSVLNGGEVIEIPDFHKEEDRKKYENDRLTPFWSFDGTKAPTLPCCSHTDYKPSETMLKNYREKVDGCK